MLLCEHNVEFNIFNELLKKITISKTITRKIVFVSFYELLKKYYLPLSKLSCVATNGTPLMTGENKYFNKRLPKNEWNLWIYIS